LRQHPNCFQVIPLRQMQGALQLLPLRSGWPAVYQAFVLASRVYNRSEFRFGLVLPGAFQPEVYHFLDR